MGLKIGMVGMRTVSIDAIKARNDNNGKERIIKESSITNINSDSDNVKGSFIPRCLLNKELTGKRKQHLTYP